MTASIDPLGDDAGVTTTTITPSTVGAALFKMMKGRRRPNGFADLKQRNPILYHALRNLIKTNFDAYDHALRMKHGGKVRINKKETLNFWFHRTTTKDQKKAEGRFHRRPVQCSLRRLQDNCQGREAVYVTSHPFSRLGVLMLDADDHKGEHGDARAACNWAASIFDEVATSLFGAGIYCDVSERGHHGYVRVDYTGMTTAELRKLCGLSGTNDDDKLPDDQTLQGLLRLAAIKRKFKSDLEVKGVPGHLLENGTYRVMGSLSRFPVLANDDQIDRFVTSPIFTITHLHQVMDRLRQIVDESPEGPTVPITMIGEEAAGKGAGGATKATAKKAAKKRLKKPKQDAQIKPVGWEPDPATRMGKLAFVLSQSLNRAATADEIIHAYEAAGQNTDDDDDGNRQTLAQKNADWLATHFRPDRKQGFTLRKDAILQLIAEHVTDEIRDAIWKKGNRSTYTDDQLAVVLYVAECTSFSRQPQKRHQWTMGNNSIRDMATKLKITLDAPPPKKRGDKAPPKKCSVEAELKKCAAMKQALVNAGLMQIINPKWTVGRSKCYSIGPRHPKHADFMTFAALVNGKTTPAPTDVVWISDMTTYTRNDDDVIWITSPATAEDPLA